MSTQQPDRAGRSRGEPEAIRKGEQTEENHKTRQERLEDALEKAAKAAEDVITRGNFTAAGKAVQMADTLSKALERVRASAAKEQPDGVFLSRAEIDAARADLMRRMDRIAKKFRPDEGGGL